MRIDVRRIMVLNADVPTGVRRIQEERSRAQASRSKDRYVRTAGQLRDPSRCRIVTLSVCYCGFYLSCGRICGRLCRSMLVCRSATTCNGSRISASGIAPQKVCSGLGIETDVLFVRCT
ncbi:hypothetical protein OE88DRAFT_246499 [Heliocybe sulcata]|uniref:Uncharacterized protein n=1 Tax=Heliocybe sulcata TaxID=5364 RepID=A0A5C3N024_9AGAM|nr:hypothetical protein OE88DRAFT_246499 [Heliocybe sulcata]